MVKRVVYHSVLLTCMSYNRDIKCQRLNEDISPPHILNNCTVCIIFLCKSIYSFIPYNYFYFLRIVLGVVLKLRISQVSMEFALTRVELKDHGCRTKKALY